MDLERYRAVAEGREPPSYVRAGPSLLDAKIERAEDILRSCSLCERGCGANRTAGEMGFCGIGPDSRYFFEQILWGEEAPVIPSHEVFFTGCNMRCKFCYSAEAVVDPSRGEAASPSKLARLIDSRRLEGAVNVNLIGGEPTVHLPSILKTLKLLESPTAVVWNSNFYMSEEAMRLLEGVVDLYLGDFRFGNDKCGREIGGTDRYFETAARNLKIAAESGDVIIRHLVLPGHVECCLRPIAQWVAASLPETPFNLMFQYTPFWEALGDPVLGRSLTAEEEEQAKEIVASYGLNTTRWNQPLAEGGNRPEGRGQIETTITIGPDGRIGIMRLHGELLGLVQALEDGTCSENGD